MNTETKKPVSRLGTLPLGYNATIFCENEEMPVIYKSAERAILCLACKKATTYVRINDLPLCPKCVQIQGDAYRKPVGA